MQDVLFYFNLTCVILSYGIQTLKIVKLKDSHGVSFQGFIINCIVHISTMTICESEYIFVISAVSFTVSAIMAGVVKYYENARVPESKMAFWVSLILSFFMVAAVAQAVKTWQHKGKTNVNIASWWIWVAVVAVNIHLVEATEVIIALSITMVMVLYVIGARKLHEAIS